MPIGNRTPRAPRHVDRLADGMQAGNAPRRARLDHLEPEAAREAVGEVVRAARHRKAAVGVIDLALIRRNISDGDLAYFTTWCPAGTSIQSLVSVEGHRWAIEDSFETAKNELGLDHNETRCWHRHVTLVMLAFAMMAMVRYRANDTTPPKRPRMPTVRS